MFQKARRRLLAGGVAGAFAAALPASARAQSGAASRGRGEPEETAVKGPAAISPLMRTVSSYIEQAVAKPLPEAVAESTRHHLLDTIAAMISGTRLLPGERAIAYVNTLGGVPEACVPGTRVVTSVVDAALTGGMLAHADE